MEITVLCTSESHPINPWLESWISTNSSGHLISLVRQKQLLPGGDLLFLISCSAIVTKDDRAAYGKTLVLHASDLPDGRGWSPHVYQLIGGAEEITVCMIEAEDAVDTGDIVAVRKFHVPRHALHDEINALLFDVELELMDYALAIFPNYSALPQLENKKARYFRRRTPEDSKLDPKTSIEDQFDLLRVCDPHRYPAFFELRGCRYKLLIEKMHEE